MSRKYLVFDHMLDLSFHGDKEEDAKVQDENGVIDTNTLMRSTRGMLRNIEERKPGTYESDGCCPCSGMPELEFW